MTMGLLLSALLILTAGGGICSFGFRRVKGVTGMGAATSVTGAVLSLGPAAIVLWTGRSVELRLPWQVPFGTFYIAVDPLTALFIIIIAGICALAAIYGVGYLKNDPGHGHPGTSWCCFNLLFASMLLVVIARNCMLFVMAWEFMSLSSFFLVMSEHEKSTVREAGWIYLTAAHLGTACLLVLFLLLGGTGANLDFDHLTAPSSPFIAGVLFVLAVFGFGAKAGIIPLHVWLPEAHPAAPSHVSAVMSGVMIKTGIYGLVRILSFLGPPPSWWGWTLLIIGAVSGIMGVLYALAQHDLKRLLAYHSVENIGIICLGLGLWLLGVAGGYPELAVLGLMGGLLHVCNHAVFKSLLFLGAGAVKRGAHTLDIDCLGGLQKLMPKTARNFLVGAAAICGLPPLNGFVSELLIYLGAFGAVVHRPAIGSLAAAGMVTLLALCAIGILAATCFTKVYGIVFLGEPRSDCTVSAQEPDGFMLYPMTALAGLCVLLGLGAPLGAALVSPVVRQLLAEPAADEVMATVRQLLIPICLGGGAILALTVLLSNLRTRLLKGRTWVQGPTWDCGYAAPTARMQYTASSFAWPVIDMLRWIVRPKLEIHMGDNDFPRKARLTSHTGDWFCQYFFAPLFRFVETLSCFLHGLQHGRNQLYVLYIAITVLLLLLLKVR
ncbi:MAG: proton-conducting transporter membrane subunit [Desulfobacterales bacterium]|nr:proton-conducting transporter membrane subunit [Desulfobacterales bacterium]